MSSMYRHALWLCLLAGVTGCSSFTGGSSTANSSQRPLFSANDRLLIARSIAEGASKVRLILATEPNSTAAIASALTGFGGTIGYEADELGYIRVDVPLNRIDSISTIPGIDIADVSPPNQFDVELESPKIRDIASKTAANNVPDGLPTPSAKTPNLNDFTGVGEVGAAQFIAAHPTYDGRGVKIAILEPVAPNVPYLQKARDLSGNIVPKLIDYHFTTSLNDISTKDRLLRAWFPVQTQVNASNGSFTVAGKSYKAPHDGAFLFGTFDIAKTYLGKDYGFTNTLHPKGTAFDSATQFGVLWDLKANTVRVDTNQDGNFANDPPLTDYAVHHDYGILHMRTGYWGVAAFTAFVNPNEAPDNYPFIIQTDPAHKWVQLSIAFSPHAVMVAASAAGSGMFNGAFNGMAPGAQIISYDQADDYPYFLESMIAAARAHADMMSGQFGVDFRYDNGHDVWDLISSRIVSHYGMLVISAAGNDGPTMTTINSPATADGAYGIGGYIRGKRFGLLYGGAVSGTDYLADYSSRGPRGDGAIKPDFLAPTEWLTGSSPLGPPGILRGDIVLPPGYEIGGGTSQATPSAAGAIALLISAAKQAHVTYSPARLWTALTESARILPEYQAYEQGAGLMNIPRAWKVLQHLPQDVPQISGSGPVVTVASASLGNRGAGLYEREGWHAGMHAQRTVTLTRTSGGNDSGKYDIQWVLDDGTFSSANNVTLPLNQPTNVAIDVFPKTSGAHSAFLELVDPDSGNMVFRQLETIVAADQLTAASHFSVSHTGMVEHRKVKSYFINVPPNTDLLAISLKVPSADSTQYFRLWTSELVDVRMPDGRKPAWETLIQPYHDGGTYARAYPKPAPGVWEIAINNPTPGMRFTKVTQTPLPPTHYTFTAAAYGTRLVRTQRMGAHAYRVTLQNTEAPFHPMQVVTDVASANRSTVTLSPDHPYATVSIDVPHNASSVFVKATPRDRRSDASIYLFNCAKNIPALKHISWVYQGACELKATGALSSGGIATTDLPSGGSGQLLNYEPTPVPGHWVAVISAVGLTDSLTLNVTAATASPAFGKITTSVPNTLVASGATWNATVHVAQTAALHGMAELIPAFATREGDTISEILPKTQNASIVLNTVPIVTHTHMPIRLFEFSP